MNYKIAVIPGDGIGPEVTKEAVKALKAIGNKFGHEFVFTEVDAGGVSIDKNGTPLTGEALEICKKNDSVLFGAIGGPKWDHLSGEERPEKAILGLRSGLGLYANLRPAVLYQPLLDACPLKAEIAQKGIDIMVMRELTGGIYFGERGRENTERGEEAYDVERYSEMEIKRIAHKAFQCALARNKHVTSVDKSNVLESSRLWRKVVIEVAKEYPDVILDHMYVDNASMQLVKNPSQFDVLLTSNLFGDILSDESSMITGSIGILPSASMGDGAFGLYEPIHGSAPDIAGQDLANPIAAVLSAAMMLKYSLNLEKESQAIEAAVNQVLEKGFRTADIASSGTVKVGTVQMGNFIVQQLNEGE